MDDSLELLKHSQKLLTLLQERRSQSQVCSPENDVNSDPQEHHSSTSSPLDNGTGDFPKEGLTEKNNKTSFKTFPVFASEPFSNFDRNWNWDKTPRSGSSTPARTGSTRIGNSKNENHNSSDKHTGFAIKEPTHVTATIPLVTLSRDDDDDDDDSRSKGQTPPVTQSKDMSIPTILIWPETEAGDNIEIDIADTLQASSPQASNPPSPPLPPPPPPPPRSVTDLENPNSFPQCETEAMKEHLNGSEDKTGKEMRSFEKDENDKKHIRPAKKEEPAPLPMNGDVSSENDDSKPVNGDIEENVPKGKLLIMRQAPTRRRSVSPESGNTFERKKPLVSILHRRSETPATVSANDLSSDVDPEHPTIGKSLNSLADQTLLENHMVPDEEKGLGADLHFHETKKRRSFCDLLLEIPRKLSNVSDDLGNVGPILKRSLANRKARKQSKVQENEKKEEEKDKSLKDCFFIILSGMYGLIIVVLGAVIPISETFAEPEPPHFFDAFYIYLFTCSVLFIFYIYTFLLRRNKKNAGFKFALNRTFNRSWSFTSRFDKETENRDDSWYRRKITTDLGPHNPNGSFYLRLGALGFGIGGMIHSGLLLGMHFQGIGGNSYCDSRIQAIKPLFHLIFTFTQLYFIFLNPKVCIHRYKTFARFGLMHMCGTNICVWFRNIVVETLHEMHREGHGMSHHPTAHHVTDGHSPKNLSHNVTPSTYGHVLVENVTHEPVHGMAVPSITCYWTEMMGKVVERASPYLYPCSIEYSLICAGIMYVLWQQVGRGPILVRVDSKDEDKDHMDQMRHNRMSVDCGSSSRGLFVGILLFVMAVITMVAFYVLVNKENMTITALALVHLSEITIYLLGIIATLAAAWRMRGLAYRPGHASILENVLIFISLTGVFIFCIFGIIAAIFHKESGLANVLSIASNLMMIIQSIIQTVFMVVASELSAFTPEDVKRKTGREFVTFLILCNLSLWGINTFETQRSEHNPIQTDFYGHMPWAILTHISVPLGIFYRFHSTVCLSNIWKNAWKDKKH